MCETCGLSGINYLAVFVAALSSFIVGWLWYGPLFGKKWMKLNGFTPESVKSGGLSMPAIMGLNYLATVLAAFGMAAIMGDKGCTHYGIHLGLIISVLWISTSRLNDVLYERKPVGLWLINSGYYLITYVLMGIIIGAWH